MACWLVWLWCLQYTLAGATTVSLRVCHILLCYSFDSVSDWAAFDLKCIKMLSNGLVCGCGVSSTLMLQPPQFHSQHLPYYVVLFFLTQSLTKRHSTYNVPQCLLMACWLVWLWCLQYTHAGTTTVSLRVCHILLCFILLTLFLTGRHSTWNVSKCCLMAWYVAVVSPVHPCWSHHSFTPGICHIMLDYSFDSIFEWAALYLKGIRMYTDDLMHGCRVSGTLMLESRQFYARPLNQLHCVLFFFDKPQESKLTIPA